MASTNEAGGRLLPSVVILATGFLGEIQLAVQAHLSGGWGVERGALEAGAFVSGVLGTWGVLTVAEALYWQAYSDRLPDPGTWQSPVPPTVRLAMRLRHWTHVKVLNSARFTVLDFLAWSIVATMAVLFWWSFT
jgi:hypothetical protein